MAGPANAASCPGFLASRVLLTAALGQTNAAPEPAPAGQAPTTPAELADANHIKELMRTQGYAAALVAARQLTQDHPDVSIYWYSYGDVLLALQRPSDALPALQKCIALDPKAGPAYWGLGVAQISTHQYDDAIASLTIAVDRLPKFLPAWEWLYKAYYEKQDLVGAENAFEARTEKDPQSLYAWYMLGKVQSYQQMPDDAIDSWEKAIAIKPDFFDALRYLGLAYARTQQYDKAISCFARAAAIKPDAEVVNNLGYTYLTMGQTDKAIEIFHQSLRIDPKYEKAVYNLADAYSREKQWAPAWQTVHALAQINPKSAQDLSRNFPAEESVASQAIAAPSTNAAASALAPAVLGSMAPPPQPIAPTSAATPPLTNSPTALLLAATPAPPTPATLPTNVLATNAPPALAPVPSAPSQSAATNAAAISAPTPISTPVVTLTNAAPSLTSAPAPASASSPSSPGFTIAPPPAWVKSIDPDSVSSSAAGGTDGGVDYLLIDNQQLVDPESAFAHYVARLVNEQGLAAGSDLRAEFDPSYQTLTIHWLKVKRDGVWTDRLRGDSFQLIRREENLDSQMLDGRYSAICHLQDVRVGDLVDFAYTVTGANPVFGGKFVSTFTTGLLWPVRLYSNQVLIPPGRTIAVKSFGGAPDPVRTTQPDGSQLLAWRQENVPASVFEPGTPPWYDALPWVELTEFKSWNEVALWGWSIFSVNDPLTPELQAVVDDIKSSHTLPETRAMAAINFVQDDIRYLGVEMGANSYKPTPPSEVLARRFGDCKDKAQLCVVLLNALGVPADVALVNTSRGEATRDLLPSPLDFDHAIVGIDLGPHRFYWADPTRTGESGQLRDLAIDDFKHALLVHPDSSFLFPVRASPASLPQVSVEQTYHVPSVTEPATLSIHTVFKGSAAEGMRASLRALSVDKVQKDYLDYYGRFYPQISVETPLHFQDFPDDNRFEVWQDYTVPGLWTRDSADAPYKASFIPFSILGVVGSTTPMPRTAPYRIDYPADVTVDEEINLFANWALESLPSHIATPNFDFTEFPSMQENVMRFQYHYVALAPDVAPSALGDYNTQISHVRDDLDCHLTYTPGLAPASLAALKVNWQGATILGSALAVSLGAAIGIYFIRRDDEEDYYHRHSQYEGIGGWLILFGLGLCLRILAYVHAAIVVVPLVIDKPRWDELTRPGTAHYDPNWATTLSLEGVAAIFFLVFWILAVVLFFKKRYTFPYLMVALLGLNLLYHVIDHTLATSIAPLNALRSPALPSNLMQVVVYCVVWIPYFLTSKRVKATFRH